MVESLYHDIKRYALDILTYEDEDYPEELASIYNPPAVLFLKGNRKLLSPETRRIAMVGARKCSTYGKQVALQFSQYLSNQGIVIVSGGAIGIDAHSHKGSLEGSSPTIAVMGCGLDQAYPPQHGPLFQHILDRGGLLISEYAPGMPPQGGNFPARNRIIGGISKAVIVVEARASSGSLITADMAINEGRDVFSVPGNVLSKTSDGNHWLLRQGAIPLIHPEDIVKEYGWHIEDSRKSIATNGTIRVQREEHEHILEYLEQEVELTFDEIRERIGIDTSRLSSLLLELELNQRIRQNAQRKYTLLP